MMPLFRKLQEEVMRILIAIALVAATLVSCKTTGAQSSAKRTNENWSGDGITQQPAGRPTTVRNAFNNFGY